MADRHLPLRPDIGQLKTQAKELLRAVRAGESDAVAAFRAAGFADPATARLAQVQRVLARDYGAASWPRLMQSCRMVDAIWKDDVQAVEALIDATPGLLHADALVRPGGKPSNWGPPMTFAANLGRDAMIGRLHARGATDHASAIDRAVLQGHIDTARLLKSMTGDLQVASGLLDGPAYTLNVAGVAYALEIGAKVKGEAGEALAPVAVVLETDSRKPQAKHAILDMFVQAGLDLPDTPVMALHRGRIDLLQRHLERDPGLLTRQFPHAAIYPPELGCHDEVLATHGTPLNGATLLHMCVDYDEMEIARWLLDKGMPVDAPAAIDADGFGGHTALFAAVVAQPHFWPNHAGRPGSDAFARLLLDRGADVNARASLRKQMHPGYFADTLREYRDVTPLSWGRRFRFRKLVSAPALELIASRGGQE